MQAPHALGADDYLTNIIGIVMRQVYAEDVFGDMPHYSYEVTWVDYVLTFLGLTSWSLRLPLGNELTWTISTMCFFYLCFPALAPRLQRLQPRTLPKLAWTMYLLQIFLMMGAFALAFSQGWNVHKKNDSDGTNDVSPSIYCN